MSGSPFLQASHKIFADQFEPDGDDYLYRQGMKRAPIRISAVERDMFVDDFVRDQNRLIWIFVAIIVAIVFAAVFFIPGYGERRHDPLTYGIAGVSMLPYLLVWRRVWNAPARALAGRPAEGAERTRSEVSRRMTANMGWGQLLALAGFSAVLWWSYAPEPQVHWGWRMLWIAAGLAALGSLGWRAWRKWR